MLTAILFATAVSSAPVDVGRFDEADFPNAKKVERRMPHAEMTRRVDAILASGQCDLPGQTKTSYDITVPYAVLMQPSGYAERVVVKDIGCAPIETLVGQVALELSNARIYRPTHQEGERWYVSDVNFARGGEFMATLDQDPDKVICRAAEPVLGSRITKKKVCRTVAEWQMHGIDREQLRRDLQHRGLDLQEGGQQGLRGSITGG